MLVKDFEEVLIDTLLHFYGKRYEDDIREQVSEDYLRVACELISSIKSIDEYDSELSFRNNKEFDEDCKREYQAYLKELERSAWRVGD